MRTIDVPNMVEKTLRYPGHAELMRVLREAGALQLETTSGLLDDGVAETATAVAALAISGIPPLNGFASKWMVYQGILAGGAATGSSNHSDEKGNGSHL